MREANVWNWLNDGKPHWLAMERFEVVNPPGVSDVYWTDKRSGQSGWLELKFCRLGDREWAAGRIPKIKPAQPMFLTRQRANGTPCGLLLEVEQTHWHLWVPSGNRHWANIMRSTSAVANITTSWITRPTTLEVIDTLRSHCAR